jgi:periplasmic mercuric ion binding protein
MKQILLLLLGILATTFGFAQQKPGKAIIKTPTVHCEQCKERIEGYVSRQYGVTSVKVDVKKKTTTVTWVSDRTNIEEIKAHIANRGYDADDVAAEPNSFNRLPKACQVVNVPIADSVVAERPVNPVQ